MLSMKYITEKDELKFYQLKIFGWKCQKEKLLQLFFNVYYNILQHAEIEARMWKEAGLIHFDVNANDNIDRKGSELHTLWRLWKHIAVKTHTQSTLEFPSCALKSPTTEEITLLVIDTLIKRVFLCLCKDREGI